MKIVDRLNDFIKLNKITYKEFDRNIGVANGYFSKQLKNKASIGSHIIERIIYAYPEINILWLLTGEGEMYKEQESIDTNSPVVQYQISINDREDLFIMELAPDLVLKSIVSLIENPNTSKVIQNVHSLNSNENIEKFLNEHEQLCIRYDGFCLSPLIRSGSIMIVKKVHQSKWVKTFDVPIIVITMNLDVYFGKSIQFIDKENVKIFRHVRSKLNCPEILLNINEIRSMWKVVGYLFSQFDGSLTESNHSKSILNIEKYINELATEIKKLKVGHQYANGE